MIRDLFDFLTYGMRPLGFLGAALGIADLFGLSGAGAAAADAAVTGAIVGGGTSALTGGNVLKGVEGGAITGGVGSGISSALGGGVLGGGIGGAAGGALGSSAIGGNALKGAELGGIGGALIGYGGSGVDTSSGLPPATAAPQGGDVAGQNIPSVTSSNIPTAPVTAGSAGTIAGVDTSGVITPPADTFPGMTWNSSTGNFEPAINPQTGMPITPSPVAGATPAGTGVVDKLLGKMTPAQELALGMQGINTLGSMKTAKAPPVNADPYGTGAAASQTANNLLAKFNNGTISPTDAASIAQFRQQQQQAIKAQYAAQGLSGSSMETQALAAADVTAQQMQQSALNNMLTQANQAAGISGPYVQNMVQQQISQNSQLQQAQAQFSSLMTQYGLYSMGGSTTPTKQTGA